MKVDIIDSHLDELKTEAVVIMLTKEQLKSHGVESKLISTIDRAIKREDFRAEPRQLVSSYIDENLNADILVLVGLGKEKELNLNNFRNALSKAVDEMKSNKVKEFGVLVPEFKNIDFDQLVVAITEGAVLSNYFFGKYKSVKEKLNFIDRVTLVHDWKNEKEKFESLIEKTIKICENTMLTRDLINENSDVATPEYIADIAKNVSTGKLTCRIMDEKEIKDSKLGLITAVGQGSRFPPRMVIMEYNGDESSKEKTALIGKGITFDTGGMNLKPTGAIETMKTDMSGAATVIYTMKTLNELNVKANVIAVVPLCENMIGPQSYKPGDVVTSYSGITVEIGNTDAEGRLILADAISYTKEKFKPNLMVDVATLTGSIVGTFGEHIIGLFTNEDKFADLIHRAGEITYERVWRLPLYKEYSDEMKSNVADINNISKGKYAGATTGAAFLAKFYKNAKWAHLDIAGMAWLDKKRNYLPRGATGVGVRLLTNYFENLTS